MPAPSGLSSPSLRDAWGAGAGMDLGCVEWVLPATTSCPHHSAGCRSQAGVGEVPLGPEVPQGMICIRTSPPGSCFPRVFTGVPCDQHDLGSGSRRADTFAGPCRSHTAGESLCLVLAGSPRPTSSGNATGAPLGTRSGSRSASSLWGA